MPHVSIAGNVQVKLFSALKSSSCISIVIGCGSFVCGHLQTEPNIGKVREDIQVVRRISFFPFLPVPAPTGW